MKILVTEGMQNKIWELSRQIRICDGVTIHAATVQAFAEVLAENPIIPTDEQAQCLWTSQLLSGKTNSDRELARLCAVEWQRRMFLAEEKNPVVIRMIGHTRGITLTRTEANEIIDAINKTVGPK